MPRKINLDFYKEVYAYLDYHTYKQTADYFKISEMQVSRIKKYYEKPKANNLLLKQLLKKMIPEFIAKGIQIDLTNEEINVIKTLQGEIA